MKTALFADSQFEQMAEEVQRLLYEVGYFVDHPVVKDLALRAGCRESTAGRVLFCKEQIAELRKRLLKQYPPEKTEPILIHPRKELRTGFGNLTPKFFNYARNKPEGGNTANFTDLIKFAQAEERITSLTIPVSRQDAPPAVEQLESIVLIAGLTDKVIGAVDATVPESVPFLAEMGNVFGHNPAVFVGSCNCINPPLRLENRTAETMLRRKSYHSQSMITPMPSIGGSGPVDIYGSIILAAAEIVGGLIISMAVDPAAPLLGYIACTQVDMRSGNATSSTTQTIRVDAGVLQLMEYSFGGGTRIGGRAYISARRPGLQAVFERFLKAVGYSALADSHYFGFAGNGNLDNGSMFSPEQFLLDLEIAGGFNSLWTPPILPAANDAAGRIIETILKNEGNFLEAEHTLAHYRDEMWSPAYFQCLTNTRNEKEILDRCQADYQTKINDYRPASYPDEVLRELKKVLEKARRALL